MMHDVTLDDHCYRYIEQNPGITALGVARMMGFDESPKARNSVQKTIRRLREKGVIISGGHIKNNWRTYQVNKNFSTMTTYPRFHSA